MATPSAPARPAPNGTGSTAPPAPSRTRDWGNLRSGAEPGSAFRGIAKGRGGGPERGGGRGGGRGGRGGRSGSGGSRNAGRNGDQANGPKTNVTPANSDNNPKPAPSAGPSTPATEKTPATTSNDRAPRPKAPSRRASRTVPALVIAPSSPTTEGPPASASSRPPNRRRRSQQHGKSPVSAAPKSGLSVETSSSQTLLRPQRARTGPPTPVGSSKEAPPHLTASSAAPDIASFDMKHNIDALVERVRAAASNRPTTPGSHIDWAGDEDDSLPDLDDWGVTTSTSIVVEDKSDNIEISPIMVDGLKHLPEPTAETTGSKNVKKTNAVFSKPADKAPLRDEEKSRRTAPPPRALQLDSSKDASLKPINSEDASSTPKSATQFSPMPDTAASQKPPLSAPATVTTPPTKAPLHPSLPAKPAAATESLVAQPKPRPVATPMRVSVPAKQPTAAEKAVEPVIAAVEEPAEPVERPPTPPPAIDPPAVVAPSELIPLTSSDESSPEPSSERGLAASIHAPSPFLESSSLPNLSHATPTGPRNFNPTHHRAHTVGRPPNFPQPSTAPSFQQRFSRSGASTPRGGIGAHHGRTHSSPPAGSKLNPRIHAHRPVITGDAISRLARTIGGVPPSRTKEVSPAKE